MKIKSKNIFESYQDFKEIIISNIDKIFNYDILIISDTFNNNHYSSDPRIIGDGILAVDKDYNLVLIKIGWNGNIWLSKKGDTSQGFYPAWGILRSGNTENIINIYQHFLDKQNIQKNALKELEKFFNNKDFLKKIKNSGMKAVVVLDDWERYKKFDFENTPDFNLYLTRECSGVKKISIEIFELKFELKINLLKKHNQIFDYHNHHIKLYSIKDHLNGKSEQVKKWYEELRKYIFNKDEDFEEISRRQYIGYQKNSRNIFAISEIRTKSFVFDGLNGSNLTKRIEGLKKEFLDINFIKKYSSKEREEKDYGFPKIEVKSDEDVEKIKKIIDYTYENLEEEIEKTKKDYYEK